MNMNVESLYFRQGETCLHMYIRHIDHPEDDMYKNDILYMTRAEVPEILRMLRGEGTIFPFFADGSYLMQFTSRGAHYIRTSGYMNRSGGTYTERWYSFDGEWFANHLEQASLINEDEEYHVEHTDITKERWRVKPNVKWVYGDGVEEAIDKDRARDDIYVDDYGHACTVQSCLDSVQIMAGNRSDGQQITVNFWFDFGFNRDNNRPHVYYYEVYDYTNSDRRLWNGGVVPHEREGGLWQFSTHS